MVELWVVVVVVLAVKRYKLIRERQRHRQTNIQTSKQIDMERDRQTDKQIDERARRIYF